jgi:cation:H+ antiporter
VGDSHVSIPLCVGVFALYHPIILMPFFDISIVILLGATLVHFLCVAIFGRLPRFVGYVLIAAYAVFLFKGLIG